MRLSSWLFNTPASEFGKTYSDDRIADVLKTNRFISGEDLEHTIMRYVALYNTQFPQSALGSRTPVQAMKAWHKSNPDLFVKKPSNHPGCDTYSPLRHIPWGRSSFAAPRCAILLFVDSMLF